MGAGPAASPLLSPHITPHHAGKQHKKGSSKKTETQQAACSFSAVPQPVLIILCPRNKVSDIQGYPGPVPPPSTCPEWRKAEHLLILTVLKSSWLHS